MDLRTFSFEAMGSKANEMAFYCTDPAQAQLCANTAIAEVRRIEAKYSRYRQDSIVSKINAAAGKTWVGLDSETSALLDFGASLHQASQGRFDLTSGVLRKHWKFSNQGPYDLPKESDIAKTLTLVDWTKVERQGEQIRLAAPGMELDFGGIGKEYAADKAASCLLEHGIEHGFVSLAGDMSVIGSRADGTPWSMAIAHPRDSNKSIASLPLIQGGLATSGDYERYFLHEGRRFCHLLNAKTGWPVNFWQSISVCAASALAAGACTTVAMLLEQDAEPFLQGSGLRYFAVNQHGEVACS